MFPTELLNGLWHTTSLERMNKILESGSILPEPKIPDSKRWCTANGEKNYPFARHLGGVSLFDFNNFNPENYSKNYPASSWFSFVPKSEKFKSTVWIQINREKIKHNLITGTDLLKKWKRGREHGHNIMPIIECAYIGELNISNFIQILLYDENTYKFTKLKI